MSEPLGALSTPWTMIEAAQRPDAPPELRCHCLEALLTRYRDPVRDYFAHFGVTDPNDRDDLAQAFFLRFLEQDWLDRLDRSRGSLRGFLMAALRNFVLKERQRASRRHPESPLTRLVSSGHIAESLAVSSADDPDRNFSREWARLLMVDAVAAFRADCQLHGLGHYFAVFERHDLHPDQFGHPSYEATAQALGCSRRDVTNHLTRARKRFSKTLRACVRQTVATDEQAEEELAQLESLLHSDASSMDL